MNLASLLKILNDEFLGLPTFPDEEVSEITANSDEVREGSIFVAVTGTNADGHQFLARAKAAGAILLIGEKDGKELGLTPDEYLRVPDSRLALGLLASQIEGNPSREMMVIGVTGTSGKTTTSYLIESILRAAGMQVGLLGTVAFRIDGKTLPSTHTTPGPIELHRLFRDMRKAGCNAVVMEVSSHALKQHRAAGVAFDGAVFTNLSPEHLDYHPDLEDYYTSKRILFREQFIRGAWWGKEPKLLVNTGDITGQRLLKETPGAMPFSIPDDAEITANGIQGLFEGVRIQSPLIGRFNAENIAAAISVTKAVGIPDGAIEAGISHLRSIPGRLEQVPDPRGGRIILVDYAHKPDALEKVLEVLKPMKVPGGKIYTVIGCGGNRDRLKRPMMGEIACRLSDCVIFTSDNPRTENPLTIISEIENGAKTFSNWKSEPDRKRAIQIAIDETKSGDFVLIAGKGHENYQIIGDEKFIFDDRDVATGALS